MSDNWQRVVVVELIIKLMRVGIGVSRAWRASAVVRRVMLLTGVICVTALRTEGGQTAGRDGKKMTSYRYNTEFYLPEKTLKNDEFLKML